MFFGGSKIILYICSTKTLTMNLNKNFPSGGKIEIVHGYRRKSDHKDLLAIARFFAAKGCSVTITTDIHYKDPQYKTVFGALIGTKYERKCPDLIIDGKFYEYENYAPPFSKLKIGNMLTKGHKQSDKLIINNNKGASDRYIMKIIHDRIRLGQVINEVWLYEKGKPRLLFKKQ
jgi:hypothetical protein